METRSKPDTVSIDEVVDPSDTVTVVVSTYRSGESGARWLATYNVDALGERSAYHQARRLASSVAEGNRLAVDDRTR